MTSAIDTSEAVLSCRHLNFAYQTEPVLHDVSLDVFPGEFVAILGRNGTGKSTLLSCLSRMLDAEFSSLTLAGMDITRAGREDIARKLSYVMQEHEQLLAFSVLDVVVMGRTAYLGMLGAPGSGDYQRAEAVLEELGIIRLAYRAYPTLSGGEKQLVLLARALLQTRHLLFLDEPTNHLDYKNRYQMLALLKDLTRQSGTAILTSLHDPNHALAFADRVILMQDGRIVADGKTVDVLTCSTVGKLYGLPVIKDGGTRFASIHPAFVDSAFSDRVLLLTGDSGAGKTTLLERAIRENPKISFGGILCSGTFQDGLRHTQTVHCLTSGASAPFSRRTGGKAGGIPFVFEPEGVALAAQALGTENLVDVDCIVVDEVGLLELQGKGHAPCLPALLSLDTPRHIWAVRPHLVQQICRHFMLGCPVIIDVTAPDARERIQAFLGKEGD